MKSRYLAILLLALSYAVKGQVRDFLPIDFRTADSIALSYPHHSLRNLPDLAFKLTAHLSTEVEKFRAIYRWTCEHIDYDHVLFEKNERQRQKLKDPAELQAWYKKGNEQMYSSLLHHHKTVCTGYAYLIRELARHAGLACEIIDGYGRQANSNVGGPGIPNHQWNAIRINGKWYLCDATWSSGSVLTSAGIYVKKFNDAYFLTDPALFIRNHYPVESQWTLLKAAPTLMEFLVRPVVYSNLFTLQTTQLIPSTFLIQVPRHEEVIVRFNAADTLPLDGISLALTSRELTVPRLQPDSAGFYSIRHRFHNRGTYLLHVLKDHAYLFSYKVQVQ